MTPRRIAALPDKAWAPVILATGAVEQHGPHLPVAVDALLGQAWLSLALDRLPAGASCYVAPPITIGKSNEHTGFPGTLMITKETLRAQMLAVARQVHAWGFRSLIIVNTHGGNLPVVVPTVREIRATLGLRAGLIGYWPSAEVSPQEAAFGIHANEIETAWLLAAAPQYVDMTKATCDYFGSLGDGSEVRPVQAPALVAWMSKDLAASGIMGDAPAATPEKGERWLEQGATAYAAGIAEACRLGRAAAGLPAQGPARLASEDPPAQAGA
jgi:creatinine amidohydrolase